MQLAHSNHGLAGTARQSNTDIYSPKLAKSVSITPARALLGDWGRVRHCTAKLPHSNFGQECTTSTIMFLSRLQRKYRKAKPKGLMHNCIRGTDKVAWQVQTDVVKQDVACLELVESVHT